MPTPLCVLYLIFCCMLLQACVYVCLTSSVSNWFPFFHGSVECMSIKNKKIYYDGPVYHRDMKLG